MKKNRMQLIKPLLVEGLDAATLKQLRKEICEESGLSERTLRRYLAAYRKHGIAGLKPKKTGRKTVEETISRKALEHAILLRKENPDHSIAQIIQHLERKGLAKPGAITRSTLQKKLADCGYSLYELSLKTRKHRNRMWVLNLKVGPYMPFGPNGTPIQVYQVAFLDDATRYVLYVAFYLTLDQTVVEDCFRRAVLLNGVPDAVSFEQGRQFLTINMEGTLAMLGIQLEESQDDVTELFNCEVNSFLREVAHERPQTLERLNTSFQAWVTKRYQTKPHPGLSGQSPQVAFRSDLRVLRLLDGSRIAEAFLST